MAEVGVVVLHYRNWPDVARTIRSIRGQTVPTDLVLVDNASADGSVDAIRQEFPDLVIIQSPVNGGYAAGMNLGRRHLGPGPVLFATHELVLAPDALEEMSRRLRGRIGAVGPVLHFLDDPQRVFSAGGYLDEELVQRHSTDVQPEPSEVDWLDGGCLLVAGEALDDVGPFDEGFFLYFEDVDYACRLARRGWKLQCVPTAMAWQRSAQHPSVLYNRNWLRFVSRNAGRAVLRSALAAQVKSALIAARRRDFVNAWQITAAVGGFLLRLPPRWLT